MRIIVLISFLCASFFFLIMSSGHAARPQPKGAGGADASSGEVSEYTIREIRNKRKAIKRSTEYYHDVVRKMLRKPAEAGDHAKVLRYHYPNTLFYQAFAQSVTNQLTEYAYTIDTSDDMNDVREAQSAYNVLLQQHLGNFDVVAFALDMSTLDVRFGNEVLLRNIYKAYVDDIKNSISLDKGRDPDYAFHIITYGEENFILEQIGGVVESSEIYKVNRKKYYNVHNLTDPSGEFRQIFINVSTPIVDTTLIQAVKEEDRTFSIPAQ